MIHHLHKHIGLKVAAFGAALLASGWAIARYEHGKNPSGPKPVTPQGNTVTPQGQVITPMNPPALPPPGSPPNDLENKAQTANDAVAAYGWQNATAMQDVTDFQNAWNAGGGSPSLTVDGKYGPNTANAVKQTGIVNSVAPYYVPGGVTGTTATPQTPGDVVANVLTAGGDDPSVGQTMGAITDVIGAIYGT